MRGLYELKEMLCRELEEIAKKQELSAGDLETVHKLTDTIKNIDKIEMLDEEYSESGYSRNGGNSYANRGEHYVRGHYSREGGSSNRSYRGGSSRNGYSRSGGIMEQMERLMDEADTEKERRAIEKCMMQLENA